MQFGFVQTLLPSVSEKVQQVTQKLQNYSTCLLRTKLCMNCSLRFQVSVLRALKKAQTTTSKVFCVVGLPNLLLNRSN